MPRKSKAQCVRHQNMTFARKHRSPNIGVGEIATESGGEQGRVSDQISNLD
jgi:hypothetical protein